MVTLKLFTMSSVSDVDALKVRNSEKEFYRYMSDKLKGYGFTKVVSFPYVYSDFIYIHEGHVGLFRFMDTNEDTFSILSEELLEIMEEEIQKAKDTLNCNNISFEIPYYYIMPYVDLAEFGLEDKRRYIIDKYIFERLINSEELFDNYLSCTFSEEEINCFQLTMMKDYYIFKKSTDLRSGKGNLSDINYFYRNHEYKAIFMDSVEIKHINSIKYGRTLIEGSSGTGKTTILFNRAIKLSKLFPNDEFIYITFNKQLVNKLKGILEMKNLKIDNLKIINFHQYILQLGKPYGLNMPISKGFKTFDTEFLKIFKKISQIYKNKRIYRGIFLDESENFSDIEIDFLLGSIYTKKSFFIVSQDKSKDIRNSRKSIWKDIDQVDFDEIIYLKTNYRACTNINNSINTFIDQARDYVEKYYGMGLEEYAKKGYTKIKNVGLSGYFLTKDINDSLRIICKQITMCLEQGYRYSDICIVYPFNSKKMKGNNYVFYQFLIKNMLKEHDIPFLIATDEMTNMTNKIGVTLSNVYTVSNLEFSVVFFLELESVELSFRKHILEEQIFLQEFNIIYTILNRSLERLYLFIEDRESDLNKNRWSQMIRESFFKLEE